MTTKINKFFLKILLLTITINCVGALVANVQFFNNTSFNVRVTLSCPSNGDTEYTLTPHFNATLALPITKCTRITFEGLDGIGQNLYASLIPVGIDYLVLDSGQINITYVPTPKSLYVMSPTHPNWQKELV